MKGKMTKRKAYDVDIAKSAKLKKPLFKKWWFWVVIVLVIGMVGGGTDDANTVSEPESKTLPSVTTDIPTDSNISIPNNEPAEQPPQEPEKTQSPIIETSKEPEAAPPVEEVPQAPATEEPVGAEYVLNTNTKRFHYPSCGSVNEIQPENKSTFTGSRDDLITQGYKSCGNCKP